MFNFYFPVQQQYIMVCSSSGTRDKSNSSRASGFTKGSQWKNESSVYKRLKNKWANAFKMALIICEGLFVQVFYNCTNSWGASYNSQPRRGQGKHCNEALCKIVRERKSYRCSKRHSCFFLKKYTSGRAPPSSFTFYLLLSKIHISNSSQKELQAEKCNQIFKCHSPTGSLWRW